MLNNWLIALLFFALIVTSFTVSARGIYQTDQDFLAETFNNEIPRSRVMWIKGDLRENISEILGHPYAGLRIRYWQNKRQTAWILDEVGKEKPISFGVVIVAGKVKNVKVLAFRESRGGEIRYPAFTRQFKHAQLNDKQLDRHIDGVSGATLSVRAMTSVVTLALYLEKFIG